MTIRRSLRACIVCAALLCALASAAVASDYGNLRYRPIGPAISGGRTTAVAGSDRDPLLYYAGGANGGVFKSADGGASWTAVFDREPAAAIGAIALDPRDDDVVWVGTGETNPRNDVAPGDGIYRSSDGGRTWTHLGLEPTHAISSISIDPRDARNVAVGALGRVFADSTARGVYVTRDGGAHWRRTLYIGPSSGVSDLVRVPGRPSTLFAGVWQFRRQPWMLTSGGPLGGIYRSDDNGATWRKLQGRGLPAGLTGRIGLSAAAGDRIYAIVQSKQGDLWRSEDGGATWHVMPHSSYVGDRPFYFSRIFADPANPNRVIDVGLILSLSKDGGATFHPIATNAGWDYHVAWWSRDGRRVVVGSDEGVVVSGDGTANFWQPYDLPFAQPYHVGLGTTLPAYRVCVGLQDDNSWCSWSSVFNTAGVLNRDWEQIGPGDGMWALPDPADPDLIWSTSTNSDTGQVYLFDPRTQQASEVSPVARSNAEAPSTLKYRFNWDTPIAFTNDAHPQALVGGNVVFESSDRGEHWTVVSPDLTRNDPSHQQASGGPIGLDISGAETSDTILDIEVSKNQPGTWWVGTDDGLVQLTRDAGQHWTDVTPPGAPAWGRVAIDASGLAAGTAYAAFDDHMNGDDRPYLFATDDYGKTWHSIAGNFPREDFVRTIREDDKDRNLLYAGSQRGIFVSYDRGASWTSLRLNMPATAIYDLEIQPQADDLVVASHGRGVWILDALTSLRELPQARSSAATLFAPRDAYEMAQYAPVNVFSGGLPDNEFVGENAPYAAIVDYYLARKPARAPRIEIADASGRVVRHLDGNDVTGVAGVNRVAWDLSEDGPVQWKGTFEENQGPKEGPLVVPGRYTVRLSVDGRSYEQPLTVEADPRDPDRARYVARHDFLTGIYAELGTVDTWLNALDDRLKRATPAQAAPLRAFQRRLTYGPRNVEDLEAPQGLRERLLDVLARIGGSNQTPTAAQSEEAAAIKALYDQLAAQYAALPSQSTR
ncbi:MAG TPA: hypothetical protein VMF61_11240 [Candidatus Acidoferrales bacterium]|nr:hypothetical protein [Candidatus Acidoferrales bacterium]